MSSEDGETKRDETGRLVIRGHAAVVAAAHDPDTFSSNVSRHLQLPNGVDGLVHRIARRFVDPFFAATEIDDLQSALRPIAADLIDTLATAGEVFDAVEDLGARYAVRAQSAWLGWSREHEDALLSWISDSRDAVRAGDRQRISRSAADFEGIIGALIAERRARPADDVTTRLMTTPTDEGETLTDPEIVSILRNWTGGDLSTLALCAGVVVHWLVAHPHHLPYLRTALNVELDAAIDEILRADDPFVSNRRVARVDTEIAGCSVRAGEVVVLDWRAANRDPTAFADPCGFDPHGHAAANLVYGTGPHSCPGRGLATLELRVLVRALLDSGEIVLAGAPVREEAPAAGFRVLPVRLVAASR